MQDFLNCRWRWFAKWVLNRVPRRWSEALEAGTAVHDVFEDFFTNGGSIATSFDKVLGCLGVGVADPDHAFVMAKVRKALLSYRPQILMYRDRYHVDETLSVEEPFEFRLFTEGTPGQFPTGTVKEWKLRGRPDRVVLVGGKVYHMQHKTVAVQKDLAQYAAIVGRSMHEGCYGHYLGWKYAQYGYGGTILNLVRKAVAGPRHPLEGLLHQTIVTVDAAARDRAKRKAVAIARDIYEAEMKGRDGIECFNDNTYFDDGHFHNTTDGYFDVLRGKASLNDNAFFMARKETY